MLFEQQDNDTHDHVSPELDTLYFCKFNFDINNRLTGVRLPEIINIVEPDSVPLTLLGNKNLCIDEEVESLQKVFEGKLEHVVILCSYNSECRFNQ